MADQEVSAGPPADSVIGRVETDRYCDECGFNMRTLPVVRDGRTRLLLTRCTECGTLAYAGAATTAGRVWLQRLGVLLLFVWMAGILGVTALLGLFETFMQMITLEEMTDWSPAGRIISDDVEHYWGFMTLVLGVSCALAFLMISIYACAAYHWNRMFHVAMALCVPLLPMTIAWQSWLHEAPYLESWAWQYLLSHAGVQMSAGLLGAMFGRVAARGLATVLLPARTRTVLGFLWLADRLPIPGTITKKGRVEPISGISSDATRHA